MYKYYISKLTKNGIPLFLHKYLDCPSLLRLKKVGYFCGMDYASKEIYDFGEYISRFDHSIDVALLTYHYTHDKAATLAGLFHDIATPCFSHVIDYMNKDYENQESTEELTEAIIKKDDYLLECLKEDGIEVDSVVDFKRHTIVDNKRPKLCADRIDGVILTGLFWTKNINKEDIDNILGHLVTYKNEDNEEELGFNDFEVASKVMEVSDSIDLICHSNEDNYMMELLSYLTKYAIERGLLRYEQLFYLTEEQVFAIFDGIKEEQFVFYYGLFKNIKLNEVPKQEMPPIKKRELNPLVKNTRIKQKA